MKGLNIPATFFTTAEAAERFADGLKSVSGYHTIGCHGFDHSPDENYRYFTFEQADNNIKKATEKIYRHLDIRPVHFRGPSMTTSAAAQEALIKHGYLSDYSVCPGRIEFSSKGWEKGWLKAPSVPYHPARGNPFSMGELPLLTVPLNSLAIPFTSGSLYLFGLTLMKLFFRKLYRNAVRKKGVIVYLFHSYEFCDFNEDGNSGKQKFLHKFYRQDRGIRSEAHLKLLKYMISFPGIKAMNGDQFFKWRSISTRV